MTKIFLVGSTGHVGGAVLDLMVSTHPGLAPVALVRDEAKAARLVRKYPTVSTVIGDLESLELLEATAKEAHVVINCAPDITHEAGVEAIFRGLKGRQPKAYYIQTSGAALIWDKPDGSKVGEKIWDDVADLDAMFALPDETTHRAQDKLVFAASPDINVAVIAPTAIYGLSPSIEHPYPLTMPFVVDAVKFLSSGFTVKEGRNIFDYVHVMDLARLYMLLLSHAIEPKESSPTVWGPRAYYFGGDRELSFADYMKAMVVILQKSGVVKTDNIKQLGTTDDAAKAVAETDEAPPPDSWAAHIGIVFGCNMRVKASRGLALGWKPQEPFMTETLEEVVEKWLGSLK